MRGEFEYNYTVNSPSFCPPLHLASSLCFEIDMRRQSLIGTYLERKGFNKMNTDQKECLPNDPTQCSNFFSFFPYLLPELMSKVRGVQDESVCGLKNSFGLTWLIVFWSHSFAIGYNLKYDKYIGAYCIIPSWNIFWSEGPTYLTLAIMSPTHAVRQTPPLSSMGGWELEVSQILIWLRRPSALCRVSQRKLITEFLGLS